MKRIILIALLVSPVYGCGSWLNFFARNSQDQYVAMAKNYQINSVSYKASGDVIFQAHGKLTPDQLVKFQDIQKRVRTADDKVAILFLSWGKMAGMRSTKPAQLDASFKTLSDAQNEMTLLSMEIKQ